MGGLKAGEQVGFRIIYPKEAELIDPEVAITISSGQRKETVELFLEGDGGASRAVPWWVGILLRHIAIHLLRARMEVALG